jgi:hypothetical protein
VPEQVIAYEAGKLGADNPETRYAVFRAGTKFLNAAHAVDSANKWRKGYGYGVEKSVRVHFADVASGEKVIARKDWAEKFRETWPRAAAVEMEGAGVALAAYRSEDAPEFGVVKGISDLADEAKSDDQWRGRASLASAAFVKAIIEKLLPTPDRPQPQRTESPLSTSRDQYPKAGWGSVKVGLCKRMDEDEALDLADCLEIPRHQRKSFKAGRTCQEVWDWLEARGKLSELPPFLASCLQREDLANLVLEWARPD